MRSHALLPRRRSVVAIPLAATLLLVASSAMADGGRRGIDWQPCGLDFPGVECGTLAVLLDYDHPRGQQTDIALLEFRLVATETRLVPCSSTPADPAVRASAWCNLALATSFFADVPVFPYLPRPGSPVLRCLSGLHEAVPEPRPSYRATHEYRGCRSGSRPPSPRRG